MKTSSFRALVGVLAFALLWVSVGHTQTVTGGVTGVVKDTAGRVIPGAQVVATNVNTGVTKSTIANNDGVYTINYLIIGDYNVAVSAKGFATQNFTGIALTLDHVAVVNAQLKVGSVANTVRVNAGTNLLDTHDATLGITIGSKEIERIPLNGENFATVTLFQPGAIDPNPSGMDSTLRNTFGNGVASQNGNRLQNNSYLVNGVPVNEFENDLIGYAPAPEAIQEVKVVSANGSTKYGAASGGETLVELKSGTNQFHGIAYEHYENQNLQANTFSNKYQHPAIPITKFSSSIYGGALGGPILRNRLFFFGDYEGYGNHSGGLGTASVFTPAMRQGDFSELLHPLLGATPIQLYNTQNNFAPYPNNQIPILNPVAKSIFSNPSLYPLPNATATNGIIANNYQGPNTAINTKQQFDISINWTPDNKDTINGFYSYSMPKSYGITPLVLTFPGVEKRPTYVVGSSWVHVFSTALVNHARFGYTIVNWNNSVPIDHTGAYGTSGDAKLGIPLPFPQKYAGFSLQNISDVSGLGNKANFQGLYDTQTYFSDDVNWLHGKHLFSIGAQLLQYQARNPTNTANGFLGVFDYLGKFTSNPNVPKAGIGFGGADFVLDQVSAAGISQESPDFVTREWQPSLYFQDTWTVSPKFTVTLGLRYSYYQPWYETSNRVDNVVQSGPNKGKIEYAGSVPAGAPPGSIVCSNRACYNPVFDQIQPRLGFAYQVSDRLVVRGGFSGTTDQAGDLANTGGEPFVKNYLENTQPVTKTSGSTPYSVQEGFTGGASTTTYPGFGAIDPNFRPAYIKQYSLTVGYAINQITSLEVGYVGEAASNLENYRNLNQLTAPGAPAPYLNLVGQTIGIFGTVSNAIANYNAIQTTFRQLPKYNLSYTVNYTYGRSLSDASGPYGTPAVNGIGGPQNGYDPLGSYGASDLDMHNTVSAIFNYTLPFGRGQHFAANDNRVLDLLIGGWDLSGDVTYYSGYPDTISGPGENEVFSDGNQRANQYRHIILHNRSLKHWFGTDPSAVPCTQPGFDNGVCAYGTAALGTFGTAAVNSERGPDWREIDASIFKEFKTYREQFLTFRVDDFNAGNISSYQEPASSVTSPVFGQITSTKSPPQQFQLSLSYTF